MEAFEESGMLDNDQVNDFNFYRFLLIFFIPQAVVHAKPKKISEPTVEGEIIHTRTYDLHITYDKYYQTPRLWIYGYNEVNILNDTYSVLNT